MRIALYLPDQPIKPLPKELVAGMSPSPDEVLAQIREQFKTQISSSQLYTLTGPDGKQMQFRVVVCQGDSAIVVQMPAGKGSSRYQIVAEMDRMLTIFDDASSPLAGEIQARLTEMAHYYGGQRSAMIDAKRVYRNLLLADTGFFPTTPNRSR